MGPVGRKTDSEVSITQLLPNLITITAIIAGLTAVRFGFQGDFEKSVQLILLAAVLDGVDGRLARMLKSDSKLGAELDSLGDFLNFGVAPALVVYFWALREAVPSEGWVAVLIYAVACVLRLARFNVASKSENQAGTSRDFVGVPAPAGAILVMLPMYLSFSVSDSPVLPAGLIGLYMVGIGFLLISRIPTPSFKTTRISRRNARFLIIGLAIAGLTIITRPWESLVLISFIYVVLVLGNLLVTSRRKRG